MITRALIISILTLLSYQFSFGKEKEFEKQEKGVANLSYAKGDVWVEIPHNLLGEELIFYTKVISTSNEFETSAGYYPQKQMFVCFHKNDSTLTLSVYDEFIQSADNESRIKEAIELGRGGSIIFSAPIEYTGDSSKTYRAKFTDFFIGDKKYLLPRDNMAYNRIQGFVVRDYDYQEDNSQITNIIADSSSFSVITEQVYGVTKKFYAVTPVGNQEQISAEIISTFYKPSKDKEYTPLKVERKMGVGEVSLLEYGSKRQGAKRIYYATRFNSKDKQEPIITFHIDSLMPKVILEAIEKSADIWNRGIANLGYNQAIKLERVYRDTDIKSPLISSIRFIRSPDIEIRSNIILNPKNGQIISSDIYIPHNIVTEMRNQMLISCATGVEGARSMNIPDSLIVKPLAAKVAYFMGECLGLVANQAGTGLIPTDSLRSATFTNSIGISNSIMDNFLINYVASGDDIREGVKWYQDRLGEYDLHSINYLYGEGDFKVNSDNFLFGNSKSSAKYSDPRALKNDLGDDKIKSARYALENLYKAVNSISKWVEDEDDNYVFRWEIWDYSVVQFFMYINPVLQNIGGVYIYNNEAIDGAKFKLVESKTQRESLEYLLELSQTCKEMDQPNLIKYADLNSTLYDFIAAEIFSTTLKKVVKIPQEHEQELSRIEGLEIISNFLFNLYKKGELSAANKKMQIKFLNQLIEQADSFEHDSQMALQLLESCKKRIEKSKKRVSLRDIGHYEYMLLTLKNYFNETKS